MGKISVLILMVWTTAFILSVSYFNQLLGQVYKIPDTLAVEQSIYDISLDQFILSRPDPQNSITFNQVTQEGLGKFNAPNESADTPSYWLYLELKGSQSIDEEYFIQLNRRHEKITAYQEFSEEIVKSQKAGRSIPPKFKTVIYGNQNYLKLNFRKGVSTRFWIKIESEMSQYWPPEVSLKPAQPLLKHLHFNDIYRAVFAAIFVVLALYNLILYFTIKELSFLFYALMVFGYALHASLAFMYISWASTTVGQVSIFTASLIILSGSRFNDLFIRCKKHLPWVHKIFNLIFIAALINALIVILNLFTGYSAFLENSTSLVAASLALLLTIISLVAGINIYKQGEIRGRQFLLLNIPVFAGALIYLFYWLGINVFDFLERTPAHVVVAAFCFYGSVTVQAILLSLIVGNSIKNLQLEKLKIQRNISQELAKKVRARTTTLNKANIQISEQSEKLRVTNSVKDRLFSIISHDLRAPLNSLSSVVQLMQSNTLSQTESAELTSKVSLTLENTTQLLNNLLFWSKSQMEGIKVNPEKLDVAEIINRNITLLDVAAKAKHLKVITNYSSNIYILADGNMFDLMIRNVLSNAIKFSREGGNISIKTETDSKSLRTQIEDDGVGIDETDLEKLFQLDNIHTSSGTHNEQGTGLGLVLCKDFAEINNGTIRIDSKISKGTSVIIELPLYQHEG